MNSRDTNILDAAGRVFMRYGISRTTMNDIAREAGVARQTLYNAYPNKEEVLRAAARKSIDETVDAVTAAWDGLDDLEEKLNSFNELVPLKWYDMVQASPDVSELVDGLHRVAREEMAQAAEMWGTRFEALFRDHAPGYAAPADLAEFFYSGALNAKYSAENRAVVETRLRMLVASIMALIAAS